MEATQPPIEGTSSSGEGTVHLRELLDSSVQWMGSRLDGVSDIERALRLNSSMPFRRNNSSIDFCLIVSQGHESVATLSSDPASDQVEVTVYRTGDNSMQQVWSSSVTLRTSTTSWSSGRSSTSLGGYISKDGQRAFIHYSLDYGQSICHTTSNSGAYWIQSRTTRYDSYLVSGDDEYIFCQRRGRGFKERDQGEVVEAFSTRTWKSYGTWTFTCHPGSVQRNFSLLRYLSIDKPICCAVDAGQPIGMDKKLCVISSSDGEQFHVQVDQRRAGSDVWIGPDRAHMVYLPEDDGQLLYWDLGKPTYTPLFSIDLPKVEKAKKFIHRINGKDTPVRHSIHKQVRHCRFSPKGEVMTVAVGNDYCLVINSFLTHNCQLVYQMFFNYELFPGWVVQSIDISEGRGVSVIGAVPHKGGAGGVFGLLATFLQVPGAYAEIRKMEEHFDNAEVNTHRLGKGGGTPLHRWIVTESHLDHEVGLTAPMTAFDREHQTKLDSEIFRGRHSASPTQTVQSRIIHLLTISYPWNSTAKAAIFLVRMKHVYYIMAVGVSSIDGLQSSTTRVLHVSDFLYGHHPEQLEIFDVDSQLVLRVSSPHDGAYSGVQFPKVHTTILGHHFMRIDAEYDILIMKSSSSAVMPSGWSITPNTAIVFTANFAAYFPPQYIGFGDHLDYGFRRKSNYNLAKFLLWMSYSHRRDNGPFFSGGELTDRLSNTYDSVYDDRLYDERNAPFQSILSCAADIDSISNRTVLVDGFLRRYHRADNLLIANSQAVSCAMPALSRARPLGVLSLMRHVSLFDFHIPGNNGIEVVAKPLEVKPRIRTRLANGHPLLESLWVIPLGLLAYVLSFFGIGTRTHRKVGSANAKTVTIPLDGFCLHKYHLHTLPRVFRFWDSESSSVFYELAGPAYYKKTPSADLPLGAHPYKPMTNPPKSSPFASFVEEVISLDDRGLQFSILTVIWFEKLVTWKMDMFGRAAYLQRVAFPLLVNVALQLALSILTADGSKPVATLVLAGLQVAVLTFLAYQKFHQMRGTWLFFRSIYNYLDVGAIALSATMAIMMASRRTPPRAFIAYSIPILWIDLILASRVFEQSGTLMILLTEMTRGVLPFLCLLAAFIVGFTFIPFFLLQASTIPDNTVANPFTDYGRALGEMITFMSNDFNSLDPWKDDMVAIRILRAIFTVVVSILLLNCLIALLNLKVEAADLKSRNIWIRQMAMLLVEIERGLLTDSERKNPHWFPRWFTYTVTESERRVWQDFVDKNPLDLGYSPDGGGQEKQPMAEETAAVSTFNEDAPPPPAPAPRNTDSSSTKANQTMTPSTSTPVPKPSPEVRTGELPLNPTNVPVSQDSTCQTTSTAPVVSSPLENKTPSPSNVPGSSHSTLIPSNSPLSTSPNLPRDKCQICDKETTMVCSTCKMVRYCSAEHQSADWKNHKKACKGKAKAVD